MGYGFESSDASIQDAVRRIATEEIGKAIATIDDSALVLGVTAHEVRKRCKKLRGLIRLVRPAFKDYRTENTVFRGTAKSLSALRDSDALIETHDALIGAFSDRIDWPSFASIRRRLVLRQKEITRSHELAETMFPIRNAMDAARTRVNDWQVTDDGYDAIADGLRNTYKRARKATASTRRNPTSKAVHASRKRVKYHWHHACLLASIWPAAMKVHSKMVKQLGHLLGMHHDLTALRRTVHNDPSAFGSACDIETLFDLIARRQRSIAMRAFVLAEKPLAERPTHLAHRWHAYWRTSCVEKRYSVTECNPNDRAAVGYLDRD